MFESFLNRFRRKWTKKNFNFEKISNKIDSIFIKNLNVETNFFEFFCTFLITANTSDVFVEVIIAFNSIFFRGSFFSDDADSAAADDVFNEKSIIEADFEKDLNEFSNDVRVELSFEIFPTNKMLFRSVIALNVNKFWKTYVFLNNWLIVLIIRNSSTTHCFENKMSISIWLNFFFIFSFSVTWN